MTLTAISRPAILFAIILTILLGSRANAAQSDDSGSFGDILLALEGEPSPILDGPSLNGPTVLGESVLIEPALSQVEPIAPVQPRGLSLNGPVATPQIGLQYDTAIQTQDPFTVAPNQIQNPFLDFEAANDPPTPKQVYESANALESPEFEPRLFAPRATLPQAVTPEAQAPPALNQPDTIVTKTIIVRPSGPDCPYRRAQSLVQLRLPPEIVARAVVPPEAFYGPSRYRPDLTGYRPRGYVPYGGRGLDWDYDRYRSQSHRSRSARYVPVYPGGHHPGYRNHHRSSHLGGRDFWIGIGF